MIKPVKVRINIHDTDRQCMCHIIREFSKIMIPKMNDERVLKGAFEVIKFGQSFATPTVNQTMTHVHFDSVTYVMWRQDF